MSVERQCWTNNVGRIPYAQTPSIMHTSYQLQSYYEWILCSLFFDDHEQAYLKYLFLSPIACDRVLCSLLQKRSQET